MRERQREDNNFGPSLLGRIYNAGFLFYALSYKPASSSAGPCYFPSL